MATPLTRVRRSSYGGLSMYMLVWLMARHSCAPTQAWADSAQSGVRSDGTAAQVCRDWAVACGTLQ